MFTHKYIHFAQEANHITFTDLVFFFSIIIMLNFQCVLQYVCVEILA